MKHQVSFVNTCLAHPPPDLLISLCPDTGDVDEFWEHVKGVYAEPFTHDVAPDTETDGLIDRIPINLVQVIGTETLGAWSKLR